MGQRISRLHSFVDALGDLSLLNKSDTTCAVVSRAQSEMSAAKGHPVKMEGEAHGLRVFFQLDEDLFHTYSTYARGTESLTDSYRLLDMTPYGRQQDFEESPAGFPQKPTYG